LTSLDGWINHATSELTEEKIAAIPLLTAQQHP
jgi:hypothetical protein